MPTLEIDSDVYEYLLKKAIRIGEDGSSILRRELSLPSPDGPANPTAQDRAEARTDEFQSFKSFLTIARAISTNATGKYLKILSYVAREKGDEFEKVLTLRGRQRLYFARSEEELNKSGNSVYPQRIPDTEYWAMTNADNIQKRQILKDALRVLGYPEELVNRAAEVLR